MSTTIANPYGCRERESYSLVSVRTSITLVRGYINLNNIYCKYRNRKSMRFFMRINFLFFRALKCVL